jgi:lipopolysaccharide assembly protein B
MDENVTLIVALLALLGGLAIGKAWERYKLQDGRWIDRRRGRDSPHYLLGLNFLVANQIDAAIEELTRAAEIGGQSLELRMILGNLYREKGQVGRAIEEHKALLQLPNLRRLEHASVLLCLGLDYKRGGFVDRAVEAFTEVVRLDPDNEYALTNLEKLYAEQHQWDEAYAMRRKLAHRREQEAEGPHHAILAYLENELGTQALKRMDYQEAARRFQAAIDLDQANPPAHLNLGDVRFLEGDVAGAADVWERLVDRAPDRAYLTFSRLESAYAKIGDAPRYRQLCARLIAANPQDWRARLALARYVAAQGKPREGLDLLFQALVHNPHALALHQAIWQILSSLQLPPELVSQYVDLTRDSIFYLDPHICVRCRYRSTELLWQCPQCHEWNTFVEERIAPAKDTEASLTG